MNENSFINNFNQVNNVQIQQNTINSEQSIEINNDFDFEKAKEIILLIKTNFLNIPFRESHVSQV